MKLLPLLLLAPALAHAGSWFDYEAGIGFNHYDVQSDGTWWQEGSAHSLRRNTPALSIGVGRDLYAYGDYGVRGHVAYVNLGHIGSECMCTSADIDYDPVHHLVKSPRVTGNSQFSGSGGAQGISLTLEPYFRYREWRFGIEGGLYAYRPDWTDTAYNPDKVITYRASHRVQWGKVAAVNIERGALGISFRHYWLPSPFTDASAPALATGANVAMLTYKW